MDVHMKAFRYANGIIWPIRTLKSFTKSLSSSLTHSWVESIDVSKYRPATANDV